VLRYQADEARTGSRQTLAVDGDRRLEGAIPDVIDASLALVDSWAPRRRAMRDDGRFGPVDVIPREAWTEAVVNAVVHRSYSMAGDHIRISIFPSRIEVSSPGRFPGFVDPSRPLEIARYARNPRIARVCSDLGYAQELGEGIRRMVDRMRGSGLGGPAARPRPLPSGPEDVDDVNHEPDAQRRQHDSREVGRAIEESANSGNDVRSTAADAKDRRENEAGHGRPSDQERNCE